HATAQADLDPRTTIAETEDRRPETRRAETRTTETRGAEDRSPEERDFDNAHTDVGNVDIVSRRRSANRAAVSSCARAASAVGPDDRLGSGAVLQDGRARRCAWSPAAGAGAPWLGCDAGVATLSGKPRWHTRRSIRPPRRRCDG